MKRPAERTARRRSKKVEVRKKRQGFAVNSVADHYVGDFKHDARTNGQRGWLVGKFMGQMPQKVDDVEIKYWELEPGPTGHRTKKSATFECTFILDGETIGLIGNHETRLVGGRYVVISPGTPNNLVKFVVKRVRGLTVKAPSDPGAKQIVSEE
jgi:mannose-6-phosphate isomerase-like protein (cupin superfamily)